MCATLASVVIGVIADANIKQVIYVEQIIVGQIKPRLQLAGAFCARVIQGGGYFPGFTALGGDDYITLSEFVGRNNLHIHFLAGYTLHLFQALLDVTQVEQLSG